MTLRCLNEETWPVMKVLAASADRGDGSQEPPASWLRV